MVQIPWGDLASQPKAVENLISMLLIRLHPNAVPVDGTGGDGGRDLFEYTETGALMNYEIKSFTGRMTKGRRQQVTDSLRSTARHQPDHWDLLVPIDANPAEAQWFDSLRSQFPFVRNWHGLTWLNTHFAAHPDLVRYAVYSDSDELVRLIAETRAEQDVMLRGIPDLAARHAALAARSKELSPHYELTIQTADTGEPIVHISPKSAHIPEEEEISFNGQIVFSTVDPAQDSRRREFEEALKFGGADVHIPTENLRDLSVTAPASLGITGTADGGSLTLLSNIQPLPEPITATLMVRPHSGPPSASVHLTFDHRSTGTAGGRLYGADAAGVIRAQFQLEMDTRRSRLNVTFIPPERGMPHVYLPALRLASTMLPGCTLEFELHHHGGKVSGPISGHLIPPDAARWWFNAFNDLAQLQELTGHYFPVTPEDLNPHEVREIKETLALLNGEHVQVPSTVITVTVTSHEALDQLEGNENVRLAAVHPNVVHEISKTRIDLGPMVQVVEARPATNLPQARHQLDRTGEATVTFPISPETPPIRYLGSALPGQQTPTGT
ncbi:hypothetical protein ACWCYY_10755 [Kitasatospora sp. NPDC001664]